MSETSGAQKSTTVGTRTVLNLTLYKRQTGGLEGVRSIDRARAAGISRATQYRWMRGLAVPDLEVAREVARRLNVDTDELFIEVAA